MHTKWLHSCPTLFNPMGFSPPGFSVHGILQARILEWVAMLSSRGSSWPSDRTRIPRVSCIGKWILYHECYLGNSCNAVKSVFFFPPVHMGDTGKIFCPCWDWFPCSHSVYFWILLSCTIQKKVNSEQLALMGRVCLNCPLFTVVLSFVGELIGIDWVMCCFLILEIFRV